VEGMKKMLQKKEGYVLVWVLIVFISAALMSSVVISSITMTVRSTNTQYNAQQAYLSAKSVAAAVADYILENDGDPAIVNTLVHQPGTGSSELGEYTVTVAYESSSKIRVAATCTFRGETARAALSLVKPPIPAGIIPTDQAIYLNGSATSGFGQCKVNGDVYAKGDFTISKGSSVLGNIVVKGKTTMSGAGMSTNHLISFGDIEITAGGTVKGDLRTKGDLSLSGNATIEGSVYADGSLNFSNGTIMGNAFIGNNASFSGGGNKIKGNFSYGGTVTTAWGNLYDFVPKGGTRITNYTPLDFSIYTAPALPLISPPSEASAPELYNPVTIIENTVIEGNKTKIYTTINSSGTFSQSVINRINSLPYSSVLTIDATNSSISLLLDNTDFTLQNGIRIEIIGTNNVFLYMTGDSSLNIQSNEYVGNQVRSTNPHLFIFGDGAQSISITNNSELNACIYIPEGSIAASGASLTPQTYKFVGSCIVKSVAISSNVYFQYSKPTLDHTPLDIFWLSESETGYAGWSIESWETN